MAALHVERSGCGEPFLLLHGAAGSSDTYGWLPDLGRTVVRIDFRGHGRSDRADSYLLGDYVEDALSVLREIGPRRSSGTRSAASSRGRSRSACRSW
jgi:pimeloyl-ACP methyl ester carboxylesterase